MIPNFVDWSYHSQVITSVKTLFSYKTCFCTRHDNAWYWKGLLEGLFQIFENWVTYIKAIEGVVLQLILEYSCWLSAGSLLKPNLGGQNDFKGDKIPPFLLKNPCHSPSLVAPGDSSLYSNILVMIKKPRVSFIRNFQSLAVT